MALTSEWGLSGAGSNTQAQPGPHRLQSVSSPPPRPALQLEGAVLSPLAPGWDVGLRTPVTGQWLSSGDPLNLAVSPSKAVGSARGLSQGGPTVSLLLQDRARGLGAGPVPTRRVCTSLPLSEGLWASSPSPRGFHSEVISASWVPAEAKPTLCAA